MYYINVSVFKRLFPAYVPSAEDVLCGSLVIENVLAERKDKTKRTLFQQCRNCSSGKSITYEFRMIMVSDLTTVALHGTPPTRLSKPGSKTTVRSRKPYDPLHITILRSV